MCQWHMFSTDRSRAEMREHVVQSNPVSEGSKAFDPNISFEWTFKIRYDLSDPERGRLRDGSAFWFQRGCCTCTSVLPVI